MTCRSCNAEYNVSMLNITGSSLMLQTEGAHTYRPPYLMSMCLNRSINSRVKSFMESNEWYSMSQQYIVVTLDSCRVQVKPHPSCQPTMLQALKINVPRHQKYSMHCEHCCDDYQARRRRGHLIHAINNKMEVTHCLGLCLLV